MAGYGGPHQNRPSHGVGSALGTVRQRKSIFQVNTRRVQVVAALSVCDTHATLREPCKRPRPRRVARAANRVRECVHLEPACQRPSRRRRNIGPGKHPGEHQLADAGLPQPGLQRRIDECVLPHFTKYVVSSSGSRSSQATPGEPATAAPRRKGSSASRRVGTRCQWRRDGRRKSRWQSIQSSAQSGAGSIMGNSPVLDRNGRINHARSRRAPPTRTHCDATRKSPAVQARATIACRAGFLSPSTAVSASMGTKYSCG